MRSSTDNWIELIRSGHLTRRGVGLLLIDGQLDGDPVLLDFVRATYPMLHRTVEGYHEALIEASKVTWKGVQRVGDWRGWELPTGDVLSWALTGSGGIEFSLHLPFGLLGARMGRYSFRSLSLTIDWVPLGPVGIRLGGAGSTLDENNETSTTFGGTMSFGGYLMDPETIFEPTQERLREGFDSINLGTGGVFREDLEHQTRGFEVDTLNWWRLIDLTDHHTKDELIPHLSHCCNEHGCKYGEPDCVVQTGEAPQLSACGKKAWCGEPGLFD